MRNSIYFYTQIRYVSPTVAMPANFHSNGMEKHIFRAPVMEIIKHHGACRGKVVGVTAKLELIRLVRINMRNDMLDP